MTQQPLTFAGEAALVRKSEAARSLWGDRYSGHVADLVYGRGELISAVAFTLGPGSWFGASEGWRPVPPNEEHRFWYVVEGQLAVHDPESGEVAVAGPGEALTWRGTRYHFGYNVGAGEVVVLDWFAPSDRLPGVAEEEQAERKRPLAGPVLGGRFELLEAWPDRREEELARRAREGAPVTVSVADSLRMVLGTERPLLVSVLTSSPRLTGGSFELRGGTSSDPEEHPGDEVVFATGGRLNVLFPETGEWFELNRLDCLYIPGGTPHEYWANGAESATGVFCVAPAYR